MELAENAEWTAQMVAIDPLRVSVEAELGKLAGEEDGKRNHGIIE
jgi:fructose/tagatose bisphosphate aldolase